jgi:hypothetical protein
MRSGNAEFDLWLISATPDALILSNLEVWSPATGETLVQARMHSAGPRQAPDHQYSTSALFLPETREMLVFKADVTLFRREGGVYRIGLDTGRKELWLPVSATLLGTYTRVETMALSLDGRFAIFGLSQEARPSTWVGVAVYDLATRDRLFFERLGSGHLCSAPQVLTGADGHFALAYRDENTRHHVLKHYRLIK